MPRNIMLALNATPDGSSPKHDFDLHNFETFSTKCGQLAVVGCRDTVPDMDIDMSVDGFTRTKLCNTANFAHLKENYYFVHVPLALISRDFYQMIVQREDPYSSLSSGCAQMPVFKLGDVVYYAISNCKASAAKYLDEHGFNICCGAIRLLDLLGYGCYTDLLEAYLNDKITLPQLAKICFGTDYQEIGDDGGLNRFSPSVARIGAYQCIWYQFFRNNIYDTTGVEIYNFDDCTYAGNGAPNYVVTDVSNRGVENFVLKCLRLRYVGYKKDVFTGAMPGTQIGAVSSVPILSNSALSLTIQGVTQPNSKNTISTVNKESIVYDVSGTSPSTLGNLMISNDNVVLDGSGVNKNDIHIMSQHTHAINKNDLSVNAFLPANTSLFSVLQLVEAQAIQKWRQKALLAGVRTRDNFRAHHGVVPRHLVDHVPDFIGSVDNLLQITEITAQSNTATDVTSQSNLGEIRGRGYGATDNKSFHFHSDDYGVLILLKAIVPDMSYTSYGIDKGNTMIYYNDFFQSEYQNIGLEDVPKYLLSSIALDPTPTDVDPSFVDHDFIDNIDEGSCGKAPRYFGYKIYPDKVHGLFNPSRGYVWHSEGYDRFGYADMQSFVISRGDFVPSFELGADNAVTISQTYMSLGKLYVSPKVVDSIFADASDNSELTDQFISTLRFNCVARMPMSVLGLPMF